MKKWMTYEEKAVERVAHSNGQRQSRAVNITTCGGVDEE
jgi:hypothetical protein